MWSLFALQLAELMHRSTASGRGDATGGAVEVDTTGDAGVVDATGDAVVMVNACNISVLQKTVKSFEG
uniref:Uncharacterized protein n=1 Tax=Chionoecetes opilio bacilliform virus TaxID=1825681 RepID=A0A1Q3DKZ7_9VIRU|nr:hypothetical protein SCV_007 [Chionoecetes opilio bacilliform virus]